jgi:molecular chaperone IbpA
MNNINYPHYSSSSTRKGNLSLYGSLVDNLSLIGFDKIFDSTVTFKNSGFPFYNIVKVDENNYQIEIALAGFTEEEIELSEQNSSLIVKGEKKVDEREYVYRGITSKKFTRMFALAEHLHVNSAKMSNGILTISLEKEIPEEAKPKIIAIES